MGHCPPFWCQFTAYIKHAPNVASWLQTLGAGHYLIINASGPFIAFNVFTDELYMYCRKLYVHSCILLYFFYVYCSTPSHEGKVLCSCLQIEWNVLV